MTIQPAHMSIEELLEHAANRPHGNSNLDYAEAVRDLLATIDALRRQLQAAALAEAEAHLAATREAHDAIAPTHVPSSVITESTSLPATLRLKKAAAPKGGGEANAARSKGTDKAMQKDVRAWAAALGIHVASHGRIPHGVVAAYNHAAGRPA